MLIGWDAIDHEFIQRHTSGFERLAAGLAEQSWPMLEQHSGALRLEIQRFAARYRTVRSAAFVYCM